MRPSQPHHGASFVALRALALLLWLALGLTGGGALAQETPDYDAWESLSASAQQTLSSSDASTERLLRLRSTLTSWRDRFQGATQINAAQIETVESQIDVLGAEPAEGAAEDPEIATRRATLESELAELRAPVVRAEESLTQVNGLISQIDSTTRSRETARILKRGQSPLDPSLWPEALTALRQSASTALGLRHDAGAASARIDMLPAILGLAVIGAFLLLRGRRLSMRAGQWARKATRHGTGVWGFLISVGQIVLPLIGLGALTGALLLLNIFSAQAEGMLLVLPVLGATVLWLRWLGSRLFPEGDPPLLPVPEAHVAPLRHAITGMALVMMADMALAFLLDLTDASDGAGAVLRFPLIIAAGVVLFRMGRLLRPVPAPTPESEADALAEGPHHGGVLARTMPLFGAVLVVVAVLGPLLAAAGYLNAADALILPAARTAMLLGLLVVLQRFINDFYGFVTGRDDEHVEALLPTLLGFALTLASLPVLALIWGARLTDLSEIWQRFIAGFSVGGAQISPRVFMVFALVFAIGFLLTRILQGAMRGSVLPKTRLDPGAQSALVSGLGYLGIFLSALIAITSAGIDLSSIALVAGALSVGIGFGLQNVVSNFVSGIILLIERPITEGDWIEAGGTMGTVRDISVRSTRIETFDRTEVIVPNADLVSGVVTNWTRGNLVGRVIIKIGVAYGTDTRRAEQILLEIGRAHPMVLANPAPAVVFTDFGASSLDFELRVILRNVKFGLDVQTELRHQIAERFAEEGIEIPFAQRDLWLRNPEALGGASWPGAATPDAQGHDLAAAPRAERGDTSTQLDEGDLG